MVNDFSISSGMIQAPVDDEHIVALELLSSGESTSYQSTLKIVSAEGSRGPRQSPQITRKHPVSWSTCWEIASSASVGEI